MFSDSSKTKIKRVLFPVLIWLLSGALGEIIAVLFATKHMTPIISGADFDTLLTYAHANWETHLVIFRNLLSLPFFVRAFIVDNARIRAEIKNGRRAESKIFAKSGKMNPGNIFVIAILTVITGLGASVFINSTFLIAGLLKVQTHVTADAYGTETLLLLASEVIIAPVTEEYLLRGLIYRRFRTYMGIYTAVTLSAVLFAILHFDIAGSIYALVFGVLCAYIYEKSGRLLYAVILHSSANVLAFFVNNSEKTNKLIGENRLVSCITGAVVLAGGMMALIWFIRQRRVS